MKTILGTKVKFFRKKTGMSQMELEMEMGAAAGMISRIEGGKVNPSKETVIEIAKVLKLNRWEIDYMIGASANPVSEEEIKEARNEIRDYFEKSNVFAYLICDRQRIWAFSEGFFRLFKSAVDEPDLLKQKIENGVQIMSILLDPAYSICKYFSKKGFEETLYFNMLRFYQELRFVQNDESVQSCIVMIKSHPVGKKIWEKIENNPNENINNANSKTINFNVYGMKVKINYSREHLSSNPRFEVIDYVPTSRVLKLVAGFG